jgi:hypothetical protein
MNTVTKVSKPTVRFRPPAGNKCARKVNTATAFLSAKRHVNLTVSLQDYVFDCSCLTSIILLECHVIINSIATGDVNKDAR